MPSNNKMTQEQLINKLHIWAMIPELTSLIEIVEEFMQDHDLPHWRLDHMEVDGYLPCVRDKLSHYEKLMTYLDQIGDDSDIDEWLPKAVAKELEKED